MRLVEVRNKDRVIEVKSKRNRRFTTLQDFLKMNINYKNSMEKRYEQSKYYKKISIRIIFHSI